MSSAPPDLPRRALLRGGRPRPHTLVHSIWDQLSSPTTLSPFGGLHLPQLPYTQLLGTMVNSALVADILISV